MIGRTFTGTGLLIAGVLLILARTSAVAEEPPVKKAKQISPELRALIAEKLAEKQAEKGEAKDEKKDGEKKEGEEPEKELFVLPEGGVPELLTFLQETIKFRPKTRDEFVQYRSRGQAAMKEAAERILKEATEEDKKLPGFDDVAPFMLSLRAQDRTLSPEDKTKLFEEIKAYLTSHEEPSTYGVAAAKALAMSLEYGGQQDEAIVVNREIGGILAKSKDEAIARTGTQMEGAARRLGLVGQPVEISGTEMDGTKFDWASLRGKVVLIDFWATWCGPCRAELPNVKKNYDLYHDKGFEVVGISLDRDREALEKFLVDEQTPWITLYDGEWKDNAVAQYYGVSGIPTVFLVDKEGKVISTRARGEVLGKLLEEQLGPADPPKEEAETKDAEEKPAVEAKTE